MHRSLNVIFDSQDQNYIVEWLVWDNDPAGDGRGEMTKAEVEWAKRFKTMNEVLDAIYNHQNWLSDISRPAKLTKTVIPAPQGGFTVEVKITPNTLKPTHDCSCCHTHRGDCPVHWADDLSDCDPY